MTGLSFPAFMGGGDTGVLIGAKDWSATPLGPLASWPRSLRSTVDLALASPLAMIVLWGPELIQIYNDNYAVIAGARHPQALGQRTRDCWPEVWTFNAPIYEAVFRGESRSFLGEKVIIERDGALVDAWFDLTYSPLRDEGGQVSGVLVIVIETTGRVFAEQKVAAEVRRQRRMFEQAPGFMTILRGPDLIFEFVNHAYTKLFGDRGYIGKTVREMFPDIADQVFPALLQNAYATGERFVASHIRILLRHSPGEAAEEHFLDFIYEPILDEDGQVTGLFIEGYDVTDAHLAQAALKELNAGLERRVAEQTFKLSRTWRVSPDLLSVVNANGTFESTNSAWQAVLGWSEEELGRTPFIDFVHPEDVERSSAAFEEVKRGNPVLRFENRYRHKDGGYRWLSWVVVPEAGEIHCSARDVTIEREQRESLRQAEEALRQSQKMEAVGQLTGGLAHDFNNLLAGISGSLELLRRRIAQGRIEEVDRYVNAAQGAAQRAAALTHRLLAFSRRQTLDPRPTDLNRLVLGMEELIRRTVGPETSMETMMAEGSPWITLVDQGQLENALLNLCINARDAMPDGGKITIETGNRWLDEHAARERDLSPGQYVLLRVSDTGTGMSQAVMAKAFDPFFTTKPIGQGTGLGLSMIHGFVRQSGGQVRLHSELGQGSTVCLYLPRHLGAEDSAGSSPPSAEEPRAREKETVLVVDDEPTVRMLVIEVLEDLGCTTLEAADGAGALKVLRSAARIDLLVTDVGLPGGMNGRQVADAARVTRPGLKVLFITGYAENAVLGQGQLDPGMHVLSKPFALEALASRVRELIAGP